MRGWREVLISIGLLVALAGSASAQSPSPVDVFAGRMPEAVAGEPMYRIPAEAEDVMRDTFIASLSEFLDPWLTRVGLDPETVPAATVTNLDLQPLLDARDAGTLTEEDRVAFETWSSLDGLMVLALWLGEDVPVGELLDAMKVADLGAVNDFTVAGRRVIDLTPAEDGADTSGATWGALVGVDGILYVLASVDDEPTLLQTIAAIPVPED